MAIVGIIPARFASTRLPGKPLLSDTGRPLIQHVVEAARRASRLDRIIVATDDTRIASAVEGFGGEVALTREDHPTGTDRVGEVTHRTWELVHGGVGVAARSLSRLERATQPPARTIKRAPARRRNTTKTTDPS